MPTVRGVHSSTSQLNVSTFMDTVGLSQRQKRVPRSRGEVDWFELVESPCTHSIFRLDVSTFYAGADIQESSDADAHSPCGGWVPRRC